MLRSQIMSRAEYFLGKELFHCQFTKKKCISFHGVQTNYDIYMHNKKQSMLYDSLGPSDIFVMKMSVISTN